MTRHNEPRAPETMRLVPGMVFAKDFRIERELDSGGMGRIYLARQLSTGKSRALKVMRPRLATDPEHLRRFLEEARRAARIKSDHVVEVIGSGVDPATGTPWLAMELLEGETLQHFVKRSGPLRLQQMREIIEQLGHALGAAHEAGIIHRDLKPENIFVCAPRRGGVAFTLKVIDFGIAVDLGDFETHVKASAPIGSPLWMAPEQLKTGLEIRRQTDVWPVGLIVYWLFTGIPYWKTGLGPKPEINQVLAEILLEPIESASSRAGRSGRHHLLPAGFDSWFARCVVRDTMARYADAREAFQALHGVLAGIEGSQAGLATRPVSVTTDATTRLRATLEMPPENQGKPLLQQSWTVRRVLAWAVIAALVIAILVTLYQEKVIDL